MFPQSLSPLVQPRAEKLVSPGLGLGRVGSGSQPSSNVWLRLSQPIARNLLQSTLESREMFSHSWSVLVHGRYNDEEQNNTKETDVLVPPDECG